jgi:hypothetical protein
MCCAAIPSKKGLREAISGGVDPEQIEDGLRHFAHLVVKAVDLLALLVEQAVPPEPLERIQHQFTRRFPAGPLLGVQRQTCPSGGRHLLAHFESVKQ